MKEYTKAILYAAISFTALGTLVLLSQPTQTPPPKLRSNNSPVWNVRLSTRSRKQLNKLNPVDKDTALKILRSLAEDPFQPLYKHEKLNEAKDTYSKRLNFSNRVVYQVDTSKKTVDVLTLQGHYDRLRFNGDDC